MKKVTLKSRKIRRNIIIILLILIFFVYGFTIRTVRYKTESDKITESIKIVFLSDLHNCFYGGFDQSGLSERIDKENPDIVIFGGDVVDQYGGTEFALKIMSINQKHIIATGKNSSLSFLFIDNVFFVFIIAHLVN